MLLTSHSLCEVCIRIKKVHHTENVCAPSSLYMAEEVTEATLMPRADLPLGSHPPRHHPPDPTISTHVFHLELPLDERALHLIAQDDVHGVGDL
jgi:hypothetical protein